MTGQRCAGYWRRTFRALLTGVGVAVIVLGVLVVGAGAAVHASAPAQAGGPAPCTTGGPPDPFHGSCGTYGGRNTFYGSYGPGFPSTLGWGFCAENAATGGFYPVPSYGYTPSAPPPGASTTGLAMLGFAFSQAQANGWWTDGGAGATADAFATAGKLLYDDVAWGQPLPAMGPAVLAAFDALESWDEQGSGASGGTEISIGIAGGGTIIPGSAFVELYAQFPATGRSVHGLNLALSATGGTFDSPSGSTSVTLATGTGGSAVVPVFASAGSATVTVDVTAQIGHPGIDFYRSDNSQAQQLAAITAPEAFHTSLSLSNQPQLVDGTLSVQKAVNDGAYYGPAGAVFDVTSQGALVTTLVTNATGLTPKTPLLPPGTYQVSEVTPPPFYEKGSTQTVTVAAGSNTVVSFVGALENRITPSTVTIQKRDGHTGAPLDGAAFDVKYDSANDGAFTEDLGECVTAGPTGTCAPPGNDGSALLPGSYEITEVTAPPGYGLGETDDTQTIFLAPGEHGSVVFDDYQGGLVIVKSGNDTAYNTIVGATFTVSGPLPSTAPVGTLTVRDPTGATGELYPLVPGTYTITETAVPKGYGAVPPVTALVTGDSPTPTMVDVLDPVQPASVTIAKVDAETGEPLAGAVFDVSYAPVPGGPYSESLGSCTTTSTGDCTPEGNDGTSALLPGDYQVVERTPPPGYVLPSNPVQDVSLAPSQAGTVTFADQPLVPVEFHKIATGNVNPTEVTYAGAVIRVSSGTPTGPSVASFTTGDNGSCTTPSLLVGGQRYCWSEVVAPAGLLPGANGCFVASLGQAAVPITVSDPGAFVAVAVRKVDASNPSVGLSGAVFDLYRVDGGRGPDAPNPPPGAPPVPGDTWVAQVTTGAGGLAQFPLQFPGYAYCVVEQTAPLDFVSSPGPHCTAVLTGSPAVPATVTVITVGDAEAMVTLRAFKFNTLTPGTGIPGATYDLYVEGQAPPSGVPSAPPLPPPASIPHDTWYSRGTTGPDGTLDFQVPAGYAWCLREVTAPVNYVLDPSLHCTAVLTSNLPLSATTIALPEVRATLHISAQKYNVEQPGTVIPGATYELVTDGPPPQGYELPAPPVDASVPPGDTYWGDGTSNSLGQLSFSIPSGFSWCMHELHAPPGYEPDPAFHCTAVLTTSSPLTSLSLALPEQPVPSPLAVLAFTGGPGAAVVLVGLLLMVGGALLVLLGRRGTGRRPGGPSRAPSPPPPDDGGRDGSAGDVVPHAFVRRERESPQSRRTGPRRRPSPGHSIASLAHVALVALVIFVAAAGTSAIGIAAAPSSAAPPSRPRAISPSAIAEHDVSSYELTDVACSTPSDCVAVGYAAHPTAQTSSAVALYSTTGGARFSPAASAPVYTSVTRRGTEEAVTGGPTCGPKVGTGDTWNSSGCEGLIRVTCPAATVCFAVGGGGHSAYLWRTADGGKTWVDLSTKIPGNGSLGAIMGIAMTTATLGSAVAVGEDTATLTHPSAPFALEIAGLATTSPAFTEASLPAGVAGLTDVACPSTTSCVAVGVDTAGGALALDSTDAGATWQVALSDTLATTPLRAIACKTATHCVAVGGAQSATEPDAAYTTDGGTSWHVLTLANVTAGTILDDVSCAAVCDAVGGPPTGALTGTLVRSLTALAATSGATYSAAVTDLNTFPLGVTTAIGLVAGGRDGTTAVAFSGLDAADLVTLPGFGASGGVACASAGCVATFGGGDQRISYTDSGGYASALGSKDKQGLSGPKCIAGTTTCVTGDQETTTGSQWHPITVTRPAGVTYGRTAVRRIGTGFAWIGCTATHCIGDEPGTTPPELVTWSPAGTVALDWAPLPAGAAGGTCTAVGSATTCLVAATSGIYQSDVTAATTVEGYTATGTAWTKVSSLVAANDYWGSLLACAPLGRMCLAIGATGGQSAAVASTAVGAGSSSWHKVRAPELATGLGTGLVCAGTGQCGLVEATTLGTNGTGEDVTTVLTTPDGGLHWSTHALAHPIHGMEPSLSCGPEAAGVPACDLSVAEAVPSGMKDFAGTAPSGSTPFGSHAALAHEVPVRTPSITEVSPAADPASRGVHALDRGVRVAHTAATTYRSVFSDTLVPEYDATAVGTADGPYNLVVRNVTGTPQQITDMGVFDAGDMPVNHTTGAITDDPTATGISPSAWPLSADTEYVISSAGPDLCSALATHSLAPGATCNIPVTFTPDRSGSVTDYVCYDYTDGTAPGNCTYLLGTTVDETQGTEAVPPGCAEGSSGCPAIDPQGVAVIPGQDAASLAGGPVAPGKVSAASPSHGLFAQALFFTGAGASAGSKLTHQMVVQNYESTESAPFSLVYQGNLSAPQYAVSNGHGDGCGPSGTAAYPYVVPADGQCVFDVTWTVPTGAAQAAVATIETDTPDVPSAGTAYGSVGLFATKGTRTTGGTPASAGAAASVIEGVTLSATPTGPATHRACTTLTGTHRRIATITATPGTLTLAPGALGTPVATVECTGKPAGPGVVVTWSSATQGHATVAPPTGLTDVASTDTAQVAAAAVGTTTIYACVGDGTATNPASAATSVDHHLCAPVTVDVVAAPHLACGALTWSLAGTAQVAEVSTRFSAPLSATLACTGAPEPTVALTWGIQTAPSGASGTFASLGGPADASAKTTAAGVGTSPPLYANAIADTPGETWPAAVTATLTGVGIPLGTYALSNTATAPPVSSCPASATAPGWVLTGAGAPETTTSGGAYSPVAETVQCETVAAATPEPTAPVAFSEPTTPPKGTWDGVTGPVAAEHTASGTFAGREVTDVATSPASVASLNLTGKPQGFVVASPTDAPLSMGGLPLGSLAYPMAITPTASCHTLGIAVDPVTVALVVGNTTTLSATVTCTGHGAPAGLPVTWHAASDVVTLSPTEGTTSAAAMLTTTATAVTPGVTSASACVTGTTTCASAQITVTRPYTCADLSISASPPLVYVGPGASAPVEADVTCNGATQPGILVDWSTTTTGVATVAPAVTATGNEGTTITTVTGTALGSTPLEACVSGTTTCATVTVVVDQSCPAETISVSPGALTLAAGAHDQLVATLDCAGVPTPGEPVTWSVSPQTTITLTPTEGDSGASGKMPVTVTGVAPGIAGASACLEGATVSIESLLDGQCAEALVDVIAPQATCVRSWSLAGTGQVARVTTRFSSPLSVTIECTGKPDAGVSVVWEVASASSTTPSGAFTETTTYATHRDATALTDATGTATSPPIVANSHANATGTYWTVTVGVGTMTTTSNGRTTHVTGPLGTYALTNTATTPSGLACPASATAPGWILSGAGAPQTTGSGGPFASVKETLTCETTAKSTPEPTASVAFTQPAGDSLGLGKGGTWDTTATRVATATTTSGTFDGREVTDVATSPESVAPKDTTGADLFYVATSPTTAPKAAGAPYVGALDYEFVVTPSVPGCPGPSISASPAQMTLTLEGTGKATASVICTGTPAPPGIPVTWTPGTPPHISVTPPSGGTTTGGTTTVTVTGTTPGTTTLHACIGGTDICSTVGVAVAGSCPAPSIAVAPTSLKVTAGHSAPLSALVSCGSHSVGEGVAVTWHSAAAGTATVAPSTGTTSATGTVPATVDGVAPGTTVVEACLTSTSTCASATVVVGAPSLLTTTTTLVATPDPADFATPVHLVATVSAAGVTIAKGTVTFTGPGGALLCTGVAITKGKATCAVATLPVGTDAIGATASPSAGDVPSSAQGTATVVPDPTVTSLTLTPATSVAGESVTLATTTQAVRGRLVTGTIAIATAPGTGVCGPVAVGSPGVTARSACATTSLPAGADPLVAAYSGSPDDHPSKAGALETVAPAPPPSTPPAKTPGTATPPATPPAAVSGTTPAPSPTPTPAAAPPAKTPGTTTRPAPLPATGGTSVPVTWHCTGRRCAPHVRVPLPAKPVPVLAPCPKNDVCVVPTTTALTCSPGAEIVGHTVPVTCTAVIRTVFDAAPPGGVATEDAGTMTTGPMSLPADGVLYLGGWRPPDAVGVYGAAAHYHGIRVGPVVYLASAASTSVSVAVAWCAVPKSSAGIGWWLATSLPWWLFLVVVPFFAWLALTRKRKLARDAHDDLIKRAMYDLDEVDEEGEGA